MRVVLAAGAEHNQRCREQYLPKPTSFDGAPAAGTNTGDALRAALAIGAADARDGGGYWCSTFKVQTIRAVAGENRESYRAGAVVTRGALANESKTR